MFGELTFWEMFVKGGATVFLLLGISILSWWIIIDRSIRVYKTRMNASVFMDQLRKMFAKKDYEGIKTLATMTPGPLGAVMLEGIKWSGKGREVMENAMQRALNFEVLRMQKYLGVLGSIGSISPFIGLFGTVLGIIRAFHDLSLSAGGGATIVADGIAEALVATAMGLFVAVPAVVAYNYFIRSIDSTETVIINAASEFADLVEGER
ncbi:MAG TPA: MotA/TolQ/ExbB proton channel family protein [Firmicutes bacterium]|nr:MotA/TolQ/ExbB proton channel family protein [Bacillota bacterium]